MDFTESTKVVYNRIQKLEPENVSKIIGYLLLQDHSEREMIRLAFSPDNLIYSLITKAKSDLGLNKPALSAPISPSQVNTSPVSDIPLQFTPFSPASAHPISSPAASRRTASAYWDAQVTGDQQQVPNLDFGSPGYSDTVPEDYRLQNHMQFLTLDDQFEFAHSVNSDFSSNYFFSEPALGPRTNRRSPSLPEFPLKICHYFSKGYCKHGNNCRYVHGHPMPEGFSQIFSTKSNDFSNDEHVVSPGSLEKLEMELAELLKSRRGMPVSIASLPMMYYEKYGKTLQAEGYLTESQRHGKAGYSLTKLLARLKNSIRVIDRCKIPHGQHSVILEEDVPKYLEYVGERNDPGGIVAGSRQIYLTFPAESIFTEHDVSIYFSKFGPVQDVRIPCQQKRMFGFVTFIFVETVKQILAKGNPHYVCGARVLVKPYREKSRLIDRKFSEKLQHPMYNSSHFIDGDSELHPMPTISDNSRLLRKQLMEENEHALEFERRRLLEFHLGPKSLNHQSYLGCSMDELKLSEEHAEFPSAERFNYLLDVLNNGSSSEGKFRRISTNYNDQDSQGINLPESPFASPIRSGISTVM
ncbi:zinc finger CCCH domain-containing protein 18 isoform X1 [Ricinus communis]|uniref:zinc finger CCCH domain-containing protein 18 isoform X1 n=1 Tax=Ricinus communis TaxID=3988 RepID=UPI00201A9B8D|nr:zinc finger CCCH domain-containing protein 18 isoform X1 [Ricinus communis]XP_015583940.2 zinc finger CCCH domain-containing protein 18 isoform X1 [Ricinus communis]XP_015583941.2 zinc finger CCCH domain-containing protein 18 isoform X1 [Ricinus communis]